jgi:hypothetical protein
MHGKEIDISVRDRKNCDGARAWTNSGPRVVAITANVSSKDIGPPPPYRAGPAASATEPRVPPEASSAENRGSRPIPVAVGRPNF